MTSTSVHQKGATMPEKKKKPTVKKRKRPQKSSVEKDVQTLAGQVAIIREALRSELGVDLDAVEARLSERA
jgi:hypothetical protein